MDLLEEHISFDSSKESEIRAAFLRNYGKLFKIDRACWSQGLGHFDCPLGDDADEVFDVLDYQERGSIRVEDLNILDADLTNQQKRQRQRAANTEVFLDIAPRHSSPILFNHEDTKLLAIPTFSCRYQSSYLLI